MAVYSFDGADLKMMLQGAVDLLGQSKEEIDSLNVFPVPDGDTGTNMYQTLVSAVKEACGTESTHIGLVAKAAAQGGLVGARGNSGVILSQVLHGFARSLHTKERASAADIASALDDGAQAAYRSVMSPVEGTILTVVRKTAEGAASRRSGDLLRLLISVSKNAFIALQETPALLPVLKQAGVVDAGGKGFVVILEGILRSLKTSPAAKGLAGEPAKDETGALQVEREYRPAAQSIKYIYCTELIIKGAHIALEKLKNDLAPFGDSLMAVGEDGLSKVHIHSNHPGLVLERCLSYGTLHDLKINNMADQSREMVTVSEQAGFDKPFGIISVGAGEGISKIMKNLGADAVVAGGQTLNPSTGEILQEIDNLAAAKIIILPNNKNIILAAEQASELSQKEVTVIPTKSIPQGLSALLTLNPQNSLETATRRMKEALSSVRTGEITTAVCDTIYKGLNIKKGDFIGLADGDLKATGNDIAKVLEEILEVLIVGEGKLVTLFSGEKMAINIATELAKSANNKFAGHDFEVQYGGQPVYDLIISIE